MSEIRFSRYYDIARISDVKEIVTRIKVNDDPADENGDAKGRRIQTVADNLARIAEIYPAVQPVGDLLDLRLRGDVPDTAVRGVVEGDAEADYSGIRLELTLPEH